MYKIARDPELNFLVDFSDRTCSRSNCLSVRKVRCERKVKSAFVLNRIVNDWNRFTSDSVC